MEESFHFSGNFPDNIEILKSFVSEGVMLVAVSFNLYFTFILITLFLFNLLVK